MTPTWKDIAQEFGWIEPRDSVRAIAEEILRLRAEVAIGRERLGPAGWKLLEELRELRTENQALKSQLAESEATVKRLQQAYLPGNWEKLEELKDQLAKSEALHEDCAATLRGWMLVRNSFGGDYAWFRTQDVAEKTESLLKALSKGDV